MAMIIFFFACHRTWQIANRNGTGLVPRVWLSLLVAAYVAAAGGSAAAADLPIVCSAGACGANGPGTWVTSGAATQSVTPTDTGNRLDIRQTTNKAVLNWAEFNIGATNSVNFDQPSASALAVNRIFQNSPSRIFGKLTANGQVYLINQNGVLFGAGAKVNVSSLIASSLEITDQAVENGILDPQLLAQGKPAFSGDGRVFVLDQNGGDTAIVIGMWLL